MRYGGLNASVPLPQALRPARVTPGGLQSRRNTATQAHSDIPPAQGLYNPDNDKDSCGELLRPWQPQAGAWGFLI